MQRFSHQRISEEQTAYATATSQCAWSCCFAGAMAGGGFGMASSGFPATDYQGIYQWAYEQAVRTTRLSYPGRYIEPSVN